MVAKIVSEINLQEIDADISETKAHIQKLKNRNSNNKWLSIAKKNKIKREAGRDIAKLNKELLKQEVERIRQQLEWYYPYLKLSQKQALFEIVNNSSVALINRPTFSQIIRGDRISLQNKALAESFLKAIKKYAEKNELANDKIEEFDLDISKEE